jgi:hemerythrin superfamily protein
MDAIAFLKKDHHAVEELFSRFESAGENAYKLKRKIVDQIIVELSKHASIEEQFLYPAARKALGEDDCDIVLESLEEHHVVKWVLNELSGLAPTAERFDAKVTVLIENVRHHVKEEESDLFPQLRKAMEPAELRALGMRLEKAKAMAPTRPHPMSPDSPPGNRMIAPVASAVDRGRDLLKSLAARPRARRNPQPTARTTH